jgi:hypothetical protein
MNVGKRMWPGGAGGMQWPAAPDVWWQAVTEPPRHRHTCMGALWPGHAAMGHRGLLENGPS